MSINSTQLLEQVVRPTLQYIDLDSLSAEILLLGTCAQESGMGTYLHQVGGPAFGIYQMEPKTHDLLWSDFLSKRPALADKVKSLLPSRSIYAKRVNELVTNLNYATAMTRIYYLQFDEELPKPDDVIGMAAYWKKYYNTPAGKGTVDEFIINYKKYVKI